MAEESKRMLSGIAGMGEAEELSFNNNNDNNDPRMTPLLLHVNIDTNTNAEEEQDDNMSYGSMSMSRSSRRRNKRKNKKHTICINDSIGASIKNINPNPYLRKKEQEIELILSPPLSDESSSTIDLWKLRELALTPGGLVNGKLVLYFTTRWIMYVCLLCICVYMYEC